MNASADTMEGMTWWDYVQKHAAGAPNSHIAQAIGITPPSVGRWSKPGGRPDPAQAAAFAREYGRPVLEAFIAAGFLTADEARERPSAPPSLASLSDDELLAEVRHRMQGGQSWSGNTSPEDKAAERPPTEAEIVEFDRRLKEAARNRAGSREGMAAERNPQASTTIDAATAQAGEENQDDGSDEPR